MLLVITFPVTFVFTRKFILSASRKRLPLKFKSKLDLYAMNCRPACVSVTRCLWQSILQTVACVPFEMGRSVEFFLEFQKQTFDNIGKLCNNHGTGVITPPFVSSCKWTAAGINFHFDFYFEWEPKVKLRCISCILMFTLCMSPTPNAQCTRLDHLLRHLPWLYLLRPSAWCGTLTCRERAPWWGWGD